jgi:hypothetical protein
MYVSGRKADWVDGRPAGRHAAWQVGRQVGRQPCRQAGRPAFTPADKEAARHESRNSVTPTTGKQRQADKEACTQRGTQEYIRWVDGK